MFGSPFWSLSFPATPIILVIFHKFKLLPTQLTDFDKLADKITTTALALWSIAGEVNPVSAQVTAQDYINFFNQTSSLIYKLDKVLYLVTLHIAYQCTHSPAAVGGRA